MNTFLLLISLLLHIVAFYFIVVLYTKYATIKKLADSQSSLLEEAENSMTSFLIEMKDENERLINELTKATRDNVPDTEKNDSQLENHLKLDSGLKMQLEKNDGASNDELPDYMNEIDEIEDVIEINHPKQKEDLPFEVEAINLYKNGYTVEQIAKKLNKGKTEIELLVKFRQSR
ncbi:hypothetical protein [Virgibacillus sp. 6R]|uniref:hypothetical protein n=1 Tax=Metabacillus sp. 22489 TaxID=3453928 RepID=UPI0011A420A3